MNFDAKVASGPLQDRGCTDIICCLVFVAFLIAWIVIFIYGVSKGTPSILLTPFDEKGNGCGYSQGFESFPYLFFYAFSPTYINSLANNFTGFTADTILKKGFCVDSCPVPSDTTANKTLTELGIRCASFNASTDNCSSYQGYNSTVWVQSFCVPDLAFVRSIAGAATSSASAVYTTLQKSDTLERWMKDVKLTWWVILISLFVAVAIALVYMYFLKCCAGVITWLMLLALIGVTLGMGFMCWKWQLSKQEQIDKINNDADNSDTTSTDQKYVYLLKAFAIIFWCVSCFVFCFVVCCYHKIALVIAIIKTTGVFVAEVCSILLVPLINTLVAGAFAAIWVVGTIYLYSVGTLEPRTYLPIGQIKWDDTTRKAWYFNLFAILWIMAFVLSLGNFIIGASCSIWYFSHDHQGNLHLETGPVRRSYYWVARYHTGSIAFGSFILAVVWAIRIAFEYLYKQLDSNKKLSKNRIIKIAMWCMRCCLDCFERIVRFINKQAFIQIGLTGKSFCPAAKDGFCVVIGHPVEFALLAGLAQLFMWLGNVVIVGGTLLVSFAIMRNVPKIENNLSSPFMPLLVIVLLTKAHFSDWNRGR